MDNGNNIFDAEYDEVPTATRERTGGPTGHIGQQQIATLPHTNGAASASDYSAFLTVATNAPPRDEAAMMKAATRIGELLGKTAFYSFPAGGGRIEGPSIDLAYALAQAWGRCVTRCMVTESSGNRVTLRGQFVDLLTIAIIERDYTATLSSAPAKFADKPDQVERWRTMQEGAAISKAVRGAILGGLPAWYVDTAMRAARAEADGKALGGKTFQEAVTDVREYFGKMGLTMPELEAWVGRPVGLWTSIEIGQLRELVTDLRTSRTTVEAVRMAGKPVAAPAGRAGLGLPPKAAEPVAKADPEPLPREATPVAPTTADEAVEPGTRRRRGWKNVLHAQGWSDEDRDWLDTDAVNRICDEALRKGPWISTSDHGIAQAKGSA